MSKRRFAFRRIKAALAPPSHANPTGATAPLLTNAIKSGLTAKSVLLPGEDPAALKLLADTLLAEYQPATDEEFLFLEEIVANKWRIRRGWNSENSLVRAEMLRQQAAVDAEFEDAESDILFALALRELTDNSNVIAHLHRQEVRYTSAANRALDQLRIAQALRKERESIDAAETSSVDNFDTPESPDPAQDTNSRDTNHMAPETTKIQNNPKPPENYPTTGVSSPTATLTRNQE